MTNRPPLSGGTGGSELSFDELLSGGQADPFAPPSDSASAPAAQERHERQDRHARRPRVRPPSVLDLRAQTPVGGVTPEVGADRVLDLGSPAHPAHPSHHTAAPVDRPPVRLPAEHPSAPVPPRVTSRAPARAAAPAPGPRREPPVTDEDRELEERVALVLRSPETLRGVHQPVVDLRSGECVGYEAFVRIADWPARSPRPWFDAAARVGLAAQLEAVALATSLRARLTMPGDRLLAVNLSTASLTDDHVLRVLDDEEDLSRLLLTPSPARDALPPATAAEALGALRSRGLLLGMKLREAGRTDLDVLAGLRPDVVVLTREFAADVHAMPWRQRLLGTVLAIAGETGAAVLATGIESVADARCLQRCGVHLGQGWLFGRPRPGFLPPPAGTEEWLRDAASPDRDDDAARRAAEANALTTPPGIPVPPVAPVPRQRPAEGRHSSQTGEQPFDQAAQPAERPRDRPADQPRERPADQPVVPTPSVVTGSTVVAVPTAGQPRERAIEPPRERAIEPQREQPGEQPGEQPFDQAVRIVERPFEPPPHPPHGQPRERPFDQHAEPPVRPLDPSPGHPALP